MLLSVAWARVGVVVETHRTIPTRPKTETPLLFSTRNIILDFLFQTCCTSILLIIQSKTYSTSARDLLLLILDGSISGRRIEGGVSKTFLDWQKEHITVFDHYVTSSVSRLRDNMHEPWQGLVLTPFSTLLNNLSFAEVTYAVDVIYSCEIVNFVGIFRSVRRWLLSWQCQGEVFSNPASSLTIDHAKSSSNLSPCE